MPWDAIAVTCKTALHADAVREELALRQKIGSLPKDVILLCVEDPQEGLGSGGASLNALLIISEHLSAKQNLSVVSTDIVKDARILIMHLGRFYSHDPCGRAFVSLPVEKADREMECLMTNFDALYHLVTNQLNSNSHPGLWVCSCDMVVYLPDDTDFNYDKIVNCDGICCISIPATAEYARYHGVYKIDEQGSVRDIIYKGKEEDIKSCLIAEDEVSLVSGIVFFSSEVAGKLLSLHTCSPVDACTYMGLDSGEEPIQLSLYFDILLSMASDVKRDDFIDGKRGNSFGRDGTVKHYKNMKLVREILWDQLRNISIKAVLLPHAKHRYLDIIDSPASYAALLKEPYLVSLPGYKGTRCCGSICKAKSSIANDCLLINSIIGKDVTVDEGTFIAHCDLEGCFKIGKNCVIIGIDDTSSRAIIDDIPDNSFIMGCNIKLTGFGAKKIFCCFWNCDAASLSDDISKIMSHTGKHNRRNSVNRDALLHILAEDAQPLPPSYHNVLPGSGDFANQHLRTIFSMKLYPLFHASLSVNMQDSLCLLKEEFSAKEYKKWKESWRISLYDILEQTDHHSEFEYRRNLSVKVSCEKLKQYLTEDAEIHLHPLYTLAVASNKHEMVLSALDEAALACASSGKSHLCARVFSCVAEVLALVAGSDAALRSGPAANRDWKNALLLLDNRELTEGIKALSEVRKSWMSSSNALIRCARHYERASHIFIRFASASVSDFMRTLPGTALADDTWVVCECPARIDVSGGWSDTPPVCYENGGAVVNLALLLEGKRPIGARVRKLHESVIKFSILESLESETITRSVTWGSVEQFLDYCRPQAEGALIKACVVLSEVVNLDSTDSLKEQLSEKYDGGFEIQTWSNLPRGSGMGTSSILAGAIIMALFHASGKVVDTKSVIHAVIMVEQMLTTGGGWQDQVGGMVGGVKICSSEAKLPLEIKVEPIDVSMEFLKSFEERAKLIYTGKTRLARNVLQEVLRNWYAKEPKIVRNCKELISNSLKCKEAFIKGDIQAIGRCLETYWKQKKVMAPGCEPSYCREIMDILKPKVLGQLLAGAGGGGFCFALFKDPISKAELCQLLKGIKDSDELQVFDATVDATGARLYKASV